MTAPREPIGYWLKHLDRQIDAAFDAAVGRHGLTRRHWQVLDLLHSGSATVEEIGTALRPFQAFGMSVADVLAELDRRGWLGRHDEGRRSLTPPGLVAHEALSADVKRIRAATTRGVTEQAYAAVTATLRRMSQNLSELAEV